MAVIGRGRAVANVFGLHVSGLLAWLVWALIHVLYLVQFESRLIVFFKMGDSGAHLQPRRAADYWRRPDGL